MTRHWLARLRTTSARPARKNDLISNGVAPYTSLSGRQSPSPVKCLIGSTPLVVRGQPTSGTKISCKLREKSCALTTSESTAREYTHEKQIECVMKSMNGVDRMPHIESDTIVRHDASVIEE